MEKFLNQASRLTEAPRLSAEEIYDRIYAAVLEHRLLPGTKLGEDRMASIFGVSRARVREVFSRLVHDGVVDLFPQRGAFVASPTPQQALDVFEMRRILEPQIVARLISTLTNEKLNALRAHHRREIEARGLGDQRAVIRLSGEFHTLLATLSGNFAMEKTMRELSTVTCLVISLYDAPTTEACREDEHRLIVEAVAARDAATAKRIILAHLDEIERKIDLSGQRGKPDLEDIFGT